MSEAEKSKLLLKQSVQKSSQENRVPVPTTSTLSPVPDVKSEDIDFHSLDFNKNEDQGKDEEILMSSDFLIKLLSCCFVKYVVWGLLSAFPIFFVEFLQKFDQPRAHTVAIGSIEVGVLYTLGKCLNFFSAYKFRKLNLKNSCSNKKIGKSGESHLFINALCQNHYKPN